MNRRYLKALAAIIVLFAVFLPLYYTFSYGRDDALGRTIQEGNASGGSTHNAPFSYGGSFLESLAFGMIGMVVVFLVFYGVFLAVRRRSKRDE